MKKIILSALLFLSFSAAQFTVINAMLQYETNPEKLTEEEMLRFELKIAQREIKEHEMGMEFFTEEDLELLKAKVSNLKNALKNIKN